MPFAGEGKMGQTFPVPPPDPPTFKKGKGNKKNFLEITKKTNK